MGRLGRGCLMGIGGAVVLLVVGAVLLAVSSGGVVFTINP